MPPSQDRFGYTQIVLEEFGFTVTMDDIDNAPTSGYDLAVIHEGVSLSSAGLARYKTTPMPLVLLKPWNVGPSGLGWATEGGDFLSGPSDSIVIQMEHPILSTLPDYENLNIGDEIVHVTDLDHDHAVGQVPIAAGTGIHIIGENADPASDQPALLALMK